MSGISFNGLGSGIPVQQIVEATIEAESVPLKYMQRDKEFYSSQISALGQISSRLSSLSDAMNDLRGLDKFQQLAAKSSKEDLFTATADHLAGATSGNYSIDVLAEARNYKIVSDSQSTTATFTGTLEITDADSTTFSFDATGMTLDQLRKAINDEAGLDGKISATIVNEGNDQARLVLKSDISGEDGRFTADFSGVDIARDEELSSYSQTYRDSLPPPQRADYDALFTDADKNLDAHIQVDGIDAYSSTNTFTNVITGVDIELTQGASTLDNTSSTLDVSRDDQAIKDNIDAFVKAYNDVVIHLNEAKKGSLYGDSTIRSIQNELREVLNTPTEGTDAADTQDNLLAMIGIETYVDKSYDPEEGGNSRNGTLEIDSAKLTEALDNNFDEVARIIGASSDLDASQPDGYAQRFADMADRLVSGGVRDGEAYKGLLQIRKDGLNSQVDRLDDRMEATNRRLDLLEERLYSQFNAIEGMVANYQSTGNYIAQQMASLPGYG
ncbi:flagellar filament capping protein FliD [Marinospirillum perlucidum]|uniref:flagellar filament capping protein FliD n=1 Tax=Marinospirillum perlucidum TaxID=1982602 RepID=UPI000DF1EA32|nr:flagellar filament capping protein FliD [Marinospirillum perlucidum]